MPAGCVLAAAGLNGTALDANRAVATGAKPFPAPPASLASLSTTRQGRLFPTASPRPLSPHPSRPSAKSTYMPLFSRSPGHYFAAACYSSLILVMIPSVSSWYVRRKSVISHG